MRRPPYLRKAFLGCLLPLLSASLLVSAALLRLQQRFSTVVPDVAGLSLSEAVRRLEESGAIPALPPGGHGPLPEALPVTGTRPEAGTWLLRGARVVLVPGLDPATLRVPELYGRSLPEARELLRKGPYSLGRVFRLPSERPRGIAAQAPAAGELGLGGPIDVVLSPGPAPPVYQSPDLVGRPQEPVLELYGRQLQRVEELLYRPAPKERQGRVLEQQPSAGAPLGTEGLRLVVGAGPQVPRWRLVRYRAPQGLSGEPLEILVDGQTVWTGAVSEGDSLRVTVPLGRNPEASVRILLSGTVAEELSPLPGG